MRKYQDEPYEVVSKKLELAELTLELGEVTQEKWRRLETMRDVLKHEEDLLKEIALKTTSLRDIMKGIQPTK